MSVAGWIGSWALGFATFLAIDMVWLGVVARSLYRDQMGSLLADRFNWGGAIAFYIAFVAAVLYFAVAPNLDGGSIFPVLRDAAIFGAIAYATYDLTSYAVIDGFPPTIAVIDIAWGAVLSTTVAAAVWGAHAALT